MAPPRTSGKGRGGQGRAAPKPSSATIAVEQARCLNLKLDGLTIMEIVAETGLPRSTVSDRIQAAMVDLVTPLAEEVRRVELARLDRWQRKLEQRIEDGEDPVRVVPVGLQVQNRRAKYLGLDAPEQVVASVAVGTEDAATADVLAAARQRAAERLAALRGTE